MILLTINLNSIGNALEYSTGIKKNEEIIWKCKVCNAGEMEKIFGMDWDNSGGTIENLNKGANLKWKIKNINENGNIIEFEIEEWLWNTEDNWGINDNNFKIKYLSNPKEYQFSQERNLLNSSFFVPFIFPVPVSEYLGDFNLTKPYDIDNRVITTINVNIEKNTISPNYPKKDISIIAMYNERGILMSYKLYIPENIVIIDIELDFLPFYVIPVIIALSSGITIAIIVYIIRKRKLKNINTKEIVKNQ